jgi:flagellar assembly factor FliW
MSDTASAAPVIARSLRFGDLTVPEESVLTADLVGLTGNRWVLISRYEVAPFWWLQSLDEPALSLPVTNPVIFFPEYRLTLDPEALEEHGLGDGDEVVVLCGLSAAEDLGDFTINLGGPIVFRAGTREGVQMPNAAGEALDTPLWRDMGLNQIELRRSELPIVKLPALMTVEDRADAGRGATNAPGDVTADGGSNVDAQVELAQTPAI